MWLFLLSVALFGASFGLWWLGRRQALKSMTAGVTPEIPVSQLTEDCSAVAAQLGSGSYRQLVKVHGRIACDSPLLSELTQTPCVAYRFSVTREYEDVHWDTDEKGNRLPTRQRKSEVVASNERTTTFWLSDASGRILVAPEHAKLEMVKSLSSFDLAQQTRMGRFQLETTLMAGQTLGYRYEESCLPVDHEVSIFAEASDEPGTLELRRPESKEALFVVSPRSFSELAKSVRTASTVLFGTSIGVAVLGAVTLLLGVFR